MKKVLILLFLFFIPIVSQATPYLCGETGYIYSEQSFCNSNCNNPCSALTVDSTGSTGSCDTSKFEGFVYNPNTQRTYALTKYANFWTDFNSTNNLNLAIIKDSEINSLLTELLSHYNTNAWIGCYDPSASTSYNTVDTSRFKWWDGTVLNYSNWHSGEPNNTLLTQDIGVVQTEGEHWCEMYKDGTWDDAGEHYNEPSSQNYKPYMPALVQWYGKLDCVNGVSSSDEDGSQSQITNDIINQYCDGVSPCYMCADMTKCQNTCPSGYTFNTVNRDCEADVTCPSGGSLNADGTDCIASPSYACPNGYTFNTVNRDCEAMAPSPTCEQDGTYDSESGQCVLSAFKGCPAYYSYDSNNDDCESYPSVVCPSGGIAQHINNQYVCRVNSTYVCPDSDYTYSMERGKCIAPADIVCPTGGTYSAGQCSTTTSNGNCPSGYTFQGGNLCTAPVTNITCPSGGAFSSTYADCEKNNETPACPVSDGYTYNSETHYCESSPLVYNCQKGGSYNASIGKCFASVVYTCPNGYTLNQQQCVSSPNYVCPNNGNYNGSYCKTNVVSTNCPSGYTLDNDKCVSQPACPDDDYISITNGQCITSLLPCSATNENLQACQKGDNDDYLCPLNRLKCTATYGNPQCPSGSTLNPDTDRCEVKPDISCPSGYTYDESIDVCVDNPTCPNSGALNPYDDLCEIVVTNSMCPSDYSFNSSYNACVKTPVCQNGGSYNSSLDKCVATISESCPSGTTKNGNLCQANPTCPSGSSYNATYNVCLKSSNPTCPSGYTYNSSTDKCESSPQCPSGTSYDGSLNKCVGSASISCPSGSSYDSSSGKCVKNATGTASSGESKVGKDGIEIKNGNIRYCFQFFGIVRNTFACGHWIPLNGSEIRTSGVCYADSLVCPTSGCSNYCLSIQVGNGKIRYCHYYNVCGKWISFNSWGTSGGYYVSNSQALQICPTSGCPQFNDNFGIQIFNHKIRYFAFDNNNGKTIYGPWIPLTASYSCPSGYTLSGTKCYTNPSYSCSAGNYNSSMNECIANSSCSSGGTLNSSTDKCVLSPARNCPSGFSYDSAIHYCKKNPSCPSSTALNSSDDKCESSITKTCPSSYTLSGNQCYSSPICNYGFYDTSINLCRLSASNVCPSGYTYNSSTKKCTDSPICPSGSNYSTTANKCTTDATYTCPSGTVYKEADHLCEINPSCSTGTYDSSEDKCYEGDNTCPYGSSHECVPIDGTNYCSNESCVPVGSATDTDNSTNKDKPADGDVTSSGCEGNVYIFNGSTEKCRTSGLETGFSNCCKKKKDWFGLGSCKSSEQKLAQMRAAGECHYVGTYCSTKELGICLQKKKSYCCFHGILARVVQEQGRKQSLPQSGWGDAKSPECEGFKPDQFQALDWDKINLSEYYSYIQKTIIPNANSNFNSAIESAGQKVKDELGN